MIIKSLKTLLLYTFVEYVVLSPTLTPSMYSSINKCLTEVFHKHLMFSQKLSIHFTNQTDTIASKILSNLNITVLVNTVEYRAESGVIDKRKLTDLVLILDERVDVTYVLNTTLWFGDTNFLIVSSSTTSLTSIFRKFWKSRIVNVFTLIEDHDGFVTFYSFLPCAPTNCSAVTPIVIDRCLNGSFETGNITEINNKERIKNMNNCPINVTMTDSKPHTIFQDECNCNGTAHATGVEGNIMSVFSKFMNFNAFYYLPRDNGAWGFVKPKPSGAVGEVFTGRSEFAIGMLGPLIDRYENLDFSNIFTPMECITFGVPRGMRKKQTVWISFLTSEFTDAVWLSTGGSFMIMMFAFWVVRKLSVVDRIFYKSSDLMFFVVTASIGVPVKSPKFETLRILFIFLVLFNFIFTSAYQSALSSKLIVPTLDKDIETFEQLLESKLEVVALKNIYTALHDIGKESDLGKLRDRFKITNQSLESAIEVMTHKRNIAYSRHRSSFLYYSLLNENSKGAVNTLKDCVYVYYPIIMAKKYSPYTNQLNKVIDSLMQGGIVNYWRNFYIYDVPPSPNVLIKLNLEKCKGIFLFTFGGMMIAFLVLMGELVHHRFFID